jgi:hypothetical protein
MPGPCHRPRRVAPAPIAPFLVLDAFGRELAEAAIINIGQADTRGGFFTRVLYLIDDLQGEHLAPCAATSIPAPTMKEKAPAI